MITADQVSGWFKIKVYRNDMITSKDVVDILESVKALRRENKYLKRQLKDSLVLLHNLTDDEKCHLDHHGYCQTHGVTNPCNNAEALTFIKDMEGTL